MNVYDEKSRSCWMEEKPTSYPVLESGQTADVVIVGSGIAGLSAAYDWRGAAHRSSCLIAGWWGAA